MAQIKKYNLEPKKVEEIKQELESLLQKFWQDYGSSLAVSGRHADIVIAPKLILGEEVNPDIAKQLATVFLSKVTLEQILAGEIQVSPGMIVINDKNGKKVTEITNKRIISTMANEATNKIGQALAKKERKKKETYLTPTENDQYTYGQIGEAVMIYLLDQGKKDSKNMFSEAAKLLSSTS